MKRMVKDNKLFTDEIPVKEHISKLIELMSQGLYEKEHIMAVSLLSAIAGESIFLLGPPGTAKSMVARRLKLVFKGAKSFEYLMSRFSTPDEIFGPVSISKLKDEDKYERLVDGYLPDAEVVFLDEIWKAGPAIQNALLTAINERIFKNGTDTLRLPMKALVAASNELPAEDEGLEALWDRFLVRMVSNCISCEKTFYKMVRSKSIEEPTIAENYLVEDSLHLKWLAAIHEVEITDEICRIVTHIRKIMTEQQKKEEITTLDYYISDRRWKKIFHLMQTSAFLNGRNAINVTDSILLIHCLWNKVEAIPVVLEAVSSAITTDLDGKITQNVKALDKLIGQLFANKPPMTVQDKQAQENQTKPRLEKGPIIVSVDTSGSMMGKPEKLTRCLLMQLIRLAKKQKRKCFVITFSVRAKALELTKPVNWGLLKKFLEEGFCGGTDGEQMLAAALNALQTKKFRMADVLIISDFFFPLPIYKTRKLMETEHAKGTRYYGLQIGETKNPYDKVLDKIWKLSV